MIINLRIFKKEYRFERIDNTKIKIYEKNKSIYIIEDFIEDKNILKIDYDSKHILSRYNTYYFSYNVLPRNYKKC